MALKTSVHLYDQNMEGREGVKRSLIGDMLLPDPLLKNDGMHVFFGAEVRYVHTSSRAGFYLDESMEGRWIYIRGHLDNYIRHYCFFVIPNLVLIMKLPFISSRAL